MKFSTAATYGLRICFLLALSQKTTTLKDLVSQTDLSEKYLEQILGKLRRAQIVEAKRGALGGYCLAKHPGEVTAGDILKAVNCDIDIAACAVGECGDTYCPNRNLILKIRNAVSGIVDNTTLEDMIYEYKCVR